MNPDGWQPRLLPIRPRPVAGETVEAYIFRLAIANHLRPSYLRRYLSGQSRWAAAIQPSRLAVLSGRSLAALSRALPGLDPAPRPPPSRRRRPWRQDERPALFAAIRHDAQAEMLSERALAARYHVHPRTIKQALASPTPPARPEAPPKSKLDPVQALIEAMLASEPGISAWRIWERLTDDHAIAVSYSSVRNYVAHRRLVRASRRAEQDRVA